MKSRTISAYRRRQHGAAALIVVMLLFFIVSMVAAYTSRNLIFEQRTSANQYRSTQALEAAEAGLEWTLTQLNAGRVGNDCIPSVTDSPLTANQSFRERYLTVNGTTGGITTFNASTGSVFPRCVFDGSGTVRANWKWRCECPVRNVPLQSTFVIHPPGGGGPAPAFVVRMNRPSALNLPPNAFRLEAASCTRLDDSCVNFSNTRGGSGDGVAGIRAVIALRGALTSPPVGALTLGGSLLGPLPSGATLTVTNADTTANGTTVHAGGTIPALATGVTGLIVQGLPGSSPLSTTITNDTSLSPVEKPGFTVADRRFAALFGMRPDTYTRQPGLPTVDCSSGCGSGVIRDTLLRNPGRPIWLAGAAGTVTLDGDVGSDTAPALLIVEGDVVLNGGANFKGLIYGRAATWTLTASGTAAVTGAIVAESNARLAGAGSTLSVRYEPAILKTLRVGYGTFVRVPGTWRDWDGTNF